MLVMVFLYGVGVWLLFRAVCFALQQTENVFYTDMTFTDFSGDVTAWLRCASDQNQ